MRSIMLIYDDVHWVAKKYATQPSTIILTVALSAAPHLQSMQTVNEDDLGHSPLIYILPVDRQVRRHGYISMQGPHRKPVKAAQDWCDMVLTSSTETKNSLLCLWRLVRIETGVLRVCERCQSRCDQWPLDQLDYLAYNDEMNTSRRSFGSGIVFFIEIYSE